MLITCICGRDFAVRRYSTIKFARFYLVGALSVLAAAPVAAQDRGSSDQPSSWPKPEITVGLFDHSANFHPLGSRLSFPDLPPGQIYEGNEEDDTADIQIGFRSAPVHGPLERIVIGGIHKRCEL